MGLCSKSFLSPSWYSNWTAINALSASNVWSDLAGRACDTCRDGENSCSTADACRELRCPATQLMGRHVLGLSVR